MRFFELGKISSRILFILHRKKKKPEIGWNHEKKTPVKFVSEQYNVGNFKNWAD